jgi:hypothetical protein
VPAEASRVTYSHVGIGCFKCPLIFFNLFDGYLGRLVNGDALNVAVTLAGASACNVIVFQI